MKASNHIFKKDIKKSRMLLHVCCANCAMHPVDILMEEFNITLYFYNPNIHPEGEYKKRLNYFQKISDIYKLPSITGEYDTQTWFNLTESFKNEPEGSKRCEICFRLRLEKTAETALEDDFDIIATTLTVSPHKSSETINKIGAEVSRKYNIAFHMASFKKKDGYIKTMELGKKYSIYRQDYCGCVYSIRK